MIEKALVVGIDSSSPVFSLSSSVGIVGGEKKEKGIEKTKPLNEDEIDVGVNRRGNEMSTSTA